MPPQGQQWATLAGLREGRRCEVRDLEPELCGLGAEPPVGIGQRALLVQTSAGNLLWDCIGFIDDAGVLRASVALNRPKECRRSLPLIRAEVAPDRAALADADVDLRTLRP